MKKRRSRKQKEKTQAKRKNQLTSGKLTQPVTSHSVAGSDGKSHEELNVFALDERLISQDLIKTVWVTVVVLLLLLVLGLVQKGIISFNNF